MLSPPLSDKRFVWFEPCLPGDEFFLWQWLSASGVNFGFGDFARLRQTRQILESATSSYVNLLQRKKIHAITASPPKKTSLALVVFLGLIRCPFGGSMWSRCPFGGSKSFLGHERVDVLLAGQCRVDVLLAGQSLFWDTSRCPFGGSMLSRCPFGGSEFFLGHE